MRTRSVMQLPAILVGGGDQHVEPALLGGGGDGGHHVVGLEADGRQHRQVHRLDDRLDARQLRDQVVRRRRPVGLVVGVERRSETSAPGRSKAQSR